MTRLARQQLVLVKSHATSADPVPTKAANAIKTYEGNLTTPNIVSVESGNCTATFSAEETRAVIATNNVEIECELTTHGKCGAPQNAVLVIEDLTYTAVDTGLAGEDVSVEYLDTGTAGAESAIVTDSLISVSMEAGVSTATQVKAAVDAVPAALALATVAVTGTGSDAQAAHAEAHLAGTIVPMRLDPLLKACGLIPTETPETGPGLGDGYTTYKPSTLAPVAAAIYANKGGMLFKTLNAFGTWELTCEQNKVGMWKFSFVGQHVAPTDEVTPTDATFDEVLPGICAGMGITVGAYTPVVRKIVFQGNNETPDRADLNATSGSAGAAITGRKIKVIITIEAPLEAAYPAYGELAAGTVRALSATIKSAVMGNVLITVPKLQGASIAQSNENGGMIYEITGNACRNSAGDDEFTMKFSKYVA